MKTDKEKAREALKRIWMDDYPLGNEGMVKLKADYDFIEKYINYLEGIYDAYERDMHLFVCVLDKANIEYMVVEDHELDNCNDTYNIMRYEDTKRVVISRNHEAKYYDEKEGDK